MSSHRLPPPPSPIGPGRRRKYSNYPPATPPLHWKFFFDDSPHKSSHNNGGGTEVASARKLAAGLWQLQLAPNQSGGRLKSKPPPRDHALGIKPSIWPAPCGNTTTTRHGEHNKNEAGLLHHHVSSDLRHGVLHNKSSRNAMVVKGDITTLYNELHCVYTRVKIIDQQYDGLLQVSSASTLHSELFRARIRIRELESERRDFRKKVGRFLGEIEEERRRAWRAREKEKLRAVFDGLKDELWRERRSRRKMEVLNARLVDELTDVRSRAERFRKRYEKEEESREVIEVVCNELATRVEEQKEELEELRKVSIRLETEIEEERRMMQMAEVWREERVQMKLNDAKFALESKYIDMLDLISQLDALLMSGNASSIEAIEPKQHEEETKEVAKGVKSNMSDGDESVHQPHGSRDLYTILEEIRGVGGNNVRVIEACNDHRTISPINESRSSNKDSNRSFEEGEHHANTLMCGDQGERTVHEAPLGQSDGLVVVEGLIGQGCVGEWSMNELLNPHITRGMQGRVEWRRGFRKCGPSSKANKRSQARMERQKARLRSVVNHRTRQ